MSYARFNDEHDDGQLSRFRDRLAAEVRVQTGREFLIFQDRTDIAWGQNWRQRIEETLDVVTLLVAVITPGFFGSEACRDEVVRFQERERRLGRSDLILPVYYVSAREMDDPAVRESDEMAQLLASRQFVDWRELRFEPLTSPLVRRAVAQLASRMRDTFWQSVPFTVRAVSQRSRQAGATAATTERADAGEQVTAKTEPPTHVVDAWQRGDFATVSEAIEAARPGDRILVRPGLYEESLVVNKPLEILGDGPVSEIEIRSRGADTLLFRASIGRVANLTLRQVDLEGTWCAVMIDQGRLDLEGCDISSSNLSCVAIRNGADPRLRRNRIHGGNQCGVYIYDNGLGTLEDNDIDGNSLAGVEIKTGGNPTVRRNQIRNGKQCGAYIYDNGLGTLEDNDISGNNLAGVEIKAGGNPTVRRNQIRDGKQDGVFVHDDGLGTIEDNDISGNTMAGVEIKTRGNPTVRHNKIRDGKTGGVYIHDEGLGTLEDNDISGNSLRGVEIKTAADPTLRRNQIRDGKTIGVYVWDDGLGTLEDNEIIDNANSGVMIRTGGNPTLRRNLINRNREEGVRILADGHGVLEDNDLTSNSKGAWNIAEDCEANVTRARNKE